MICLPQLPDSYKDRHRLLNKLWLEGGQTCIYLFGSFQSGCKAYIWHRREWAETVGVFGDKVEQLNDSVGICLYSWLWAEGGRQRDSSLISVMFYFHFLRFCRLSELPWPGWFHKIEDFLLRKRGCSTCIVIILVRFKGIRWLLCIKMSEKNCFYDIKCINMIFLISSCAWYVFKWF